MRQFVLDFICFMVGHDDPRTIHSGSGFPGFLMKRRCRRCHRMAWLRVNTWSRG